MTAREIYQQRRQAVVDQITRHPESFAMDSWVAPGEGPDPLCGTTCCIAGWAALHRTDIKLAARPFGEVLFLWTSDDVPVAGLLEAAAADWLGIPEEAAGHLFWGEFVPDDRFLRDVTPDEAAAALMAAPYVEEAPDAT